MSDKFASNFLTVVLKLNRVTASSNSFNITSCAFTISPTSGPIGSVVSATGTNFASASAFTVNSTAGLVINQSNSLLTGYVMPGSTSGNITIATTSYGTCTSSVPYTVTATNVPTTQVGSKISAPDGYSGGAFGTSVPASADGSTLAVSSTNDNNYDGAVFIFVKSGNNWVSQATLIGTAAGQRANLGLGNYGVAISADGNTVAVGGPYYRGSAGAVRLFLRLRPIAPPAHK